MAAKLRLPSAEVIAKSLTEGLSAGTNAPSPLVNLSDLKLDSSSLTARIRTVAKGLSLSDSSLPSDETLSAFTTLSSLSERLHDLLKDQLAGSEETVKAKCLTVMKSVGDNKPTLYMIHDGFGLSAPYASLVKHLDMNLVGINDPFIGVPKKAFPSVESMAAFYISQIKEVTPELPKIINILGWSFGGSVAVEMALQLEKEKRRVRLVLVDSFNLSLGGAGEDVQDAMDDEENPLRMHILDQGHSDAMADAMLQESKSNMRIGTAYKPSKAVSSSKTSVTLVKAMRHPYDPTRTLGPEDGYLADPMNNWGTLLGREPRRVEMSVNHYACFSERHAGEVAEVIRKALW